MSPEDVELLQLLGRRLLVSLAPSFTHMLFYGCFILLFLISLSTFIHRGLSSSAAWVMLVATCLSFAFATLNISAQIAGFIVFIRVPLISHVDGLPEDRRAITNAALFVPNVIIEWANIFLPLLSDAVVIWRAWVLFPERKRIMIAPLILLLASIATSATYLALISSPAGIASSDANGLIDNFFAACIGLSMATNAVTTSLIAYRLWIHRKFLVHNLGLEGSRKRSPAQKVLFLLIESGVIYFGFQLVFFVLSILPQEPELNASYVAWEIFCAAYIGVSAMYPTIVVVLVHHHRTIVDTCGIGSEAKSHDERISHLSFAAPATESLTSVGSLSPQISRTLDEMERGGEKKLTT